MGMINERIRLGTNNGDQPDCIIKRTLKDCGFNEEHREFGAWGVAYYRRIGYEYKLLRGNLAVYELERVEQLR